MSFFGILLSESLLQAAGLSLLHSIWQVAVIALIVFVLLQSLKKATANSRYIVASIGLVATLIVPVITFYKIYEPDTIEAVIAEEQAGIMEIAYTLADSQLNIESWIDKVELFIMSLAPLFFWFWIVGMVFMAIRMSGGYFLAYRYRSHGVVPAPAIWQQRVKQLGQSLKVKSTVQLLESQRVMVPMVVGILRPCIIIPIGTLSRLPFDQVEMILAHELAHIKRADFAINFIQSLIETILFFNPFVWWISAVIRQERENICDDMALQTTGGYLSLAKALANLSAALQPIPLSDSLITFNQLNTMKRIQRLIRKPKLKPSTSERIGVIVFSFLFVLLVTASGMLTGSNSSENPAQIVQQDFSDTSLLESAQLNDLTLATDTIIKKSKTVEIEKKDGKIVKMIIDGKEVPAEDLKKEGFEWTESEGGEVQKIIVRSNNDGSTTVDVDATGDIFIDKNGKTIRHKIVNAESLPGQKMKVKTIVLNGESDNDSIQMELENIVIIDDSTMELNGGEIRMIKVPGGNAFFYGNDNEELNEFEFDIELDDEMLQEMERNGNRKIIIHGSDMNIEREQLNMQAAQIKEQAELLKQDAAKLAETDQAAAEIMKADAEAMEIEAKNIQKAAAELARLPRPDFPNHLQAPSWNEDNVFFFNNEENDDRQYHKLLRKELTRDQYINPKANVLISKKQLVIDNVVADKKTHRYVLKRTEEILGRKLESDEAISLMK